MLKIEYRFVDYDENLTVKEKSALLHNEAYSLLDSMLVNIGVSDYKIKKTDSGKPYIENSNAHFSIAHTDGLVCCVVADKACGIDCEKIVPRDRCEEFCKRYFTKEEISFMEKCSYSSEELLRIWTCKEAIGKRLGCGVIKAINIDSTKENCSTIIENGYIITINI